MDRTKYIVHVYHTEFVICERVHDDLNYGVVVDKVPRTFDENDTDQHFDKQMTFIREKYPDSEFGNWWFDKLDFKWVTE